MRKNLVKKGLALVIITLFIGMSITPSSGNIISSNDTTPPVTTHTLDPPEPDGLNGWYVSNVNVTLNATDDMSGVKEIIYEVDGGQGIIKGDKGTFTITQKYDGDDVLVEYWAIDNSGNKEPRNSFTIDMDQTRPLIDLTYSIEHDIYFGWIWVFYANASDWTSGMDYVEFYKDDVLQATVMGHGPSYEWIWDYFFLNNVRGLILNPEISDEYVKCYAIMVITFDRMWNFYEYFYAYGYDKAGNRQKDSVSEGHPPDYPPKIYLFQNITLPNNYTGYIGRYFIWAEFEPP